MIQSLQLFSERLHELDPDDVAFVSNVDELVEQTSPELLESLYPIVFRFVEAHPEHDCGMPGMLVHSIEQCYPNYVTELLDSVTRAPSLNTVLMVNRILNSDIANEPRTSLLESLCAVVRRQDVSSLLQEEARGYLERHT